MSGRHRIPFEGMLAPARGSPRWIVLLMWIMVGSAVPACAAPETISDASVVFCLSDEQRPRLVQAAVTLGLARSGGAADRVIKDGLELSLADWRVQHSADFKRACDALAAPALAEPASPKPSSDSVAVLLATLNTLVGALIGFFVALWRDRLLRGERQSQALRAATNEFVTTTGSYLRMWTDDAENRPLDTNFYQRCGDLRAELRDVLNWHSEWKIPIERILGMLSADFGEDMAANSATWEPDNEIATAERVGNLQEKLDRLVTDIDKVIRALEHPFRGNSMMREDAGQSQQETGS